MRASGGHHRWRAQGSPELGWGSTASSAWDGPCYSIVAGYHGCTQCRQQVTCSRSHSVDGRRGRAEVMGPVSRKAGEPQGLSPGSSHSEHKEQ